MREANKIPWWTFRIKVDRVECFIDHTEEATDYLINLRHNTMKARLLWPYNFVSIWEALWKRR